jgi:hypothetical protein
MEDLLGWPELLTWQEWYLMFEVRGAVSAPSEPLANNLELAKFPMFEVEGMKLRSVDSVDDEENRNPDEVDKQRGVHQ